MGKKRGKQWTAAGAARSAREARIESVAFLGTPAMAQWHVGALAGAYAVCLNHHGDHEMAMAQMFGGLGYMPPWPQDWVTASEMIRKEEARCLRNADLYVVSPEMATVVTAAALTLTVQDLELMGKDDPPSPSGLVVLPAPLLNRTLSGDLGDLKALTWRSPARLIVARDGKPTALPAIRMSSYNDGHGPVRPASWTEFTDRAAAAGTPVPPLFFESPRCWAYGRAASARDLQVLEEFGESSRQYGQDMHARAAAAGLDEDYVAGEYTPGDEIDDKDDLLVVKWLYAFWRLCEQRIAVTGEAPVTHSARVTAERAGVPAGARVVELRRQDRWRDAAGPAGTVDWQHRWTVRMHKVRQWYPSLGRHQIIYRGPYVKGPDGKPFLDQPPVWGLTR